VIRVLPFLVQLALMVFCLVDCIQSDSSEVRGISKGWWILLIIFFPIIGGVAWLAAGRPHRSRGRDVPWPSTATSGFPEYERPRRPVGPDDDPEFLREMRRGNDEQEQLLQSWEDDLRRREQALRPPTDAAKDEEDGEPGRAPA
jgi:hypothetical protein